MSHAGGYSSSVEAQGSSAADGEFLAGKTQGSAAPRDIMQAPIETPLTGKIMSRTRGARES